MEECGGLVSEGAKAGEGEADGEEAAGVETRGATRHDEEASVPMRPVTDRPST